jgi:hypothetical protein
MYFEKAVNTKAINMGKDIGLVASLNGLLILGLGIFPAALMQYCLSVIN